MLTFLSLMFATFVSEDLACISAGLLIQHGQTSASSAVAACALGIFAGDLGLWSIGRVFGRAALAWPWIAGSLRSTRGDDLRRWLERHACQAILASRFLPGTRLPLYVIAGLIELPAHVFATWALLGTLLWTPAVVLLTAIFGDGFAQAIMPVVGSGVVTHMMAVAAIVLVFFGIRSGSARLTSLVTPHRA
jgi:membrane protein DedA with SNARE-associated domain